MLEKIIIRKEFDKTGKNNGQHIAFLQNLDGGEEEKGEGIENIPSLIQNDNLVYYLASVTPGNWKSGN